MKLTRLRRHATQQLGRFYQLYYRYYRAGRDSNLVLFYPDFPDRRAAILQIASAMGLTLTNNPKLKCDLAFFWQDATFREPDETLKELAGRTKVVNFHCRDISKSRVDEAFRESFGYSSFVDPTTYVGKCVRKSELNAQHDGFVIEAPIKEKVEGFIYQKLLQRVEEDTLVVDFRVGVFGNTLTSFCTRYKEIENRFGRSISQRLADERTYLSEEERGNILKFCRKIGLEYGEIDMIRDEKDQRLYLLDANNTPFWPLRSFNISQEDRQGMLDQYEAAFREQFLEPGHKQAPAAMGEQAGVAGS